MIRRGLIGLGAVVLAGLMLVLAMPLIASTQIVRDRIAFELSAWTGYRVTLGAAPEISVWPAFRAMLSEVELRDWSNGELPPVFEADQVEIDLSPLAALRGEIVFSRVSLVRPVMRVSEKASVRSLAEFTGGGRLMRSIAQTRRIVDASPDNPDTGALPENPFGIIEFTDGRINVTGEDGEEPAVTSLAGRLSWPTLGRAATLTATGIWRGESVAVEASSARPLILLAGGDASMRLSLKSSPADLSFEGSANLAEAPYFAGQVQFSSPSLRRLLEWSQTEIAAGGSIGSVSLAGSVSGNGSRLSIESVEIDLNGSLGTGVLDFSMSDDMPTVTGTLAFRSLDLRSFLATFSPVAGGKGRMHDPVDLELASQINLDLRLSAATAALGDIPLGEVAATVQVKEGLSVLDISDATAFDGTVQAGVRIDRGAGESIVELRLRADRIDAAAFTLVSGMKRMVPQTRADMSLVAKGSGHDWNEVLANAEGTLTVTLGEGTVAGLDLPAFLARSQDGTFFALSDVGGGTTAISGAELKATIEQGLFRIQKLRAWSDGKTIDLDGIVPFLGRAFALSGRVAPTVGEDDPPAVPDAQFFIGGGWDAPFISPVRQHDFD